MHQRPLDEKTDPLPVVGLVPRLYLGAIFCIAAYGKIAAPHGYVEAVRAFVTGAGAANAPAWYASFLSTAVVPHLATWALAVVAGEAFVGIALVLGIFTRLAAAVAIYMLVNYLFATGLPIWAPTSHDAPDIVLAFIVLMTGPGRVFDLDRLFAR